MPICSDCGATNRDGARYCFQCSTRLATRARPSDEEWLVATLSAGPASNAPTNDPRDATARDVGSRGEMSMEQPQPDATTSALFGGRYELVEQEGDGSAARVVAVDRKPWLRCWACGATSNEAGELFCTECGASLEGRRYPGQLIREGEPTGLALAAGVDDPQAAAVLPQIWDQVRDGEALLTLVVESGRPPLAPPLDELDALRAGQGLARLLAALHSRGLALGAVAPEDLELAASGGPRLRSLERLRRATKPKADAAADLKGLAALLEGLTATPRTTRRLEEGSDAADDVALPGILRSLRTGAAGGAAEVAERFDELLAERTHPRPLWTRVGASSHNGMVRPLDEDSLLALDLRAVQNAQGRSWGLYIVADGMGGHAAGEIASGLAIRGAAEAVMRSYLTPTLETDAPEEEARLKEVVRKAALQANDFVRREAEARGNDMGTTLTMALVAGDRAVVGNVGDSRTYLYRGGELRRLSKDHSLVQRLVDLGQITDEEIYTHPQRNAVLRSLGDKADIEVDVFSLRLRPGDALLLCSDGQWEMTRDPEMAAILAQHDDPQTAAEALVAAANRAGGEDNITVVLVKFEKYEE